MFTFQDIEEAANPEVASTVDEGSSELDSIDLTEEQRTQVEEVIEKHVEAAVTEAVEVVEGAEVIEEETTQIEETVEASERFMKYYDVIKEYGISRPMVAFLDVGGFLKFVAKKDPTISCEHFSVVPETGQKQEMALLAISETIANAAKAVYAIIKKIIVSIKSFIGNFINSFKNYKSQTEIYIKKLNDSKIDEKTLSSVRVEKVLSQKNLNELIDNHVKVCKTFIEGVNKVGSFDLKNPNEENLKKFAESYSDMISTVEGISSKVDTTSLNASLASLGYNKSGLLLVGSSLKVLLTYIASSKSESDKVLSTLNKNEKAVADFLKGANENKSDVKFAINEYGKATRAVASSYTRLFNSIPGEFFRLWVKCSKAYLNASAPAKEEAKKA